MFTFSDSLLELETKNYRILHSYSLTGILHKNKNKKLTTRGTHGLALFN